MRTLLLQPRSAIQLEKAGSQTPASKDDGYTPLDGAVLSDYY
jgi:hypothetical protein